MGETPAWIVAVAAIIAILVNAGILTFYMGRLTNRVATLEREIQEIKEELKEGLKETRDEITHLIQGLSSIEGFLQGYTQSRGGLHEPG